MIAAENNELNGLPRASGNAFAEYARRGGTPRKKRSALSDALSGRLKTSSWVAPQDIILSRHFAGTGFFVFSRHIKKSFYERKNKNEKPTDPLQNLP
ncbi:MAG: hypothetical protein IJK60_03420 [Clostridia bacterium]|nr:hypothetical protein [Clostridia bacterium]